MVIYHAKIFDGDTFSTHSSVTIEAGIITALGNSDCGDMDLEGAILSPGFVDTHIHGYLGFDSMGGADALAGLASALCRVGTTAFFPTLVTASPERTRDFLSSLKAAGRPAGAKIPGAHLEGPFLSFDKRGAHDAGLLLPPSIEAYHSVTGGDDSLVRRVTLAPELDGDYALTRHLVERGIAVSAGHTSANGSEALSAIDAGITTCVHFFNAMPALHHRNRNMTSIGLSDPRMKLEFIPDLFHVSCDSVKIILRCKGDTGCFICTDCLPCAGLPDGEYTLGSIDITIHSGGIYTLDGTIAGSSITMLEGIRRLHSIGIPLSTALRLGTSGPADAFGLRLGRIAPGYPADMVVLDSALALRQVLVDGAQFLPCH